MARLASRVDGRRGLKLEIVADPQVVDGRFRDTALRLDKLGDIGDTGDEFDQYKETHQIPTFTAMPMQSGEATRGDRPPWPRGNVVVRRMDSRERTGDKGRVHWVIKPDHPLGRNGEGAGPGGL